MPSLEEDMNLHLGWLSQVGSSINLRLTERTNVGKIGDEKREPETTRIEIFIHAPAR